MRKLTEILDDVLGGQRPSYDELRYALVAMHALHHFDHIALVRLAGRESAGKYRKELFGLGHEAERSLERFQNALRQDPKTYVGSHDPDSPEQQRFVKMARGLAKQFGPLVDTSGE